jgi:hypothetical protein
MPADTPKPDFDALSRTPPPSLMLFRYRTPIRDDPVAPSPLGS